MSKNIKVVLLIILIFLSFIIITNPEIFELIKYYTMTETEKISQDIEIELKSAKIIFDRDKHGGFHGDGERYTCLKIQDDDFKDAL